jgi:hypothetical protein
MIAPVAPMAASIFFCLLELCCKNKNVVTKKILRTAGIALVEKALQIRS